MLQEPSVPDDYPFLDDPAERAWLTEVSPTDVRDNAHRMYEFMRETGQGAESFIRELAFQKAATALGISYETLYDAWLEERPVMHGPVPATWFGCGVWPTCKCSYSPRDNALLNAHWRERGFRVVDEHGALVVHNV